MANAKAYMSAFLLFCTGAASGCDVDNAVEQQRREAWEGRCRDTSTLLATTAGSPSEYTCRNRLHRMRVQVASAPAHEEFGALVFCQCIRDGEADAGQ